MRSAVGDLGDVGLNADQIATFSDPSRRAPFSATRGIEIRDRHLGA